MTTTFESLEQITMFDSGELEVPQSQWQIKREREEDCSDVGLSDVTILSFGAGQDSTYILHKLHYDLEYRARYAPGRLLIVHADTGDEHDETYEHVERIKEICAARNQHFVHVTPDMGYHRPNWQSLFGQFYANDNLCGTGLTRSCTDNLKLVPIYRWLADQLASDYDLPDQRDAKGLFQTARTLRAFVARHGRVRMLLGIAAKEERRMYGAMQPSWRGEVVMRQYPMAFEDIDRLAAIQGILDMGEVVPPPSHCMRCHYQGPVQLLLLAREHPDKFAEWVEREQAKIVKNEAGCLAKGVDNLGVYREKLLPEMLGEAQRQYGAYSTAALREIAFTRGCSAAAY